MDEKEIKNPDSPTDIESTLKTEALANPREVLIQILSGGNNKKYLRFAMAALGSLPWVGNLLTSVANLTNAGAGLSGEKEQEQVNILLALWVEEHQQKFLNLVETLAEIFSRFENFGDDIRKRVESPEYLNLVRRAFTSWDQADTEDKRQMYKRLLISAGATTLCEDDLVRLFIIWIDSYHEAHFKVIREIFQNPDGISRGEIWDNLYGERPSDNSSKAGLYSYLTSELSLGRIISQEKKVDSSGHVLKKTHSSYSGKSPFKESPFESTKPYYLTELGKEFVHYVMKDVANQISE